MNHVATLLGKARDGHRVLPLSVSSTAGGVLSPYFRLLESAYRKVGTGRNNSFISDFMAKMYVNNLSIDMVASDNTTEYVTFDYNVPGFSSGSNSFGFSASANRRDLSLAIRQGLYDWYTNILGQVGTDDDIIITFPDSWIPKSFANPTRSLNSAFQVSTTRDAMVTYTVDIASTLSLTTGQSGTVTLQYADDSGMSTNLKTVQSSVNGNSGTLAIGLGLTQTSTASLNGMVPAGKYVKLVTANTVGTPTFTMRAAQEVLL